MMYVAMQLREPEGTVVPKGPRFSSGRDVVCDLDGTALRFHVPRHRPRRNQDELRPPRRLDLEEIHFSSDNDKRTHANWNRFEFYQGSWAFYGPWFTGTMAELGLNVSLIRPEYDQPRDFSLFHPRAFENTVADYLTYLHCVFSIEGKSKFITPVNWTPLTQLPVVAVRLEVWPDESISSATIKHQVFFPLDDHTFVSFWFLPSQLCNKTIEECDRRVSRAPMYALMDQIIDSISLSLSPEARARRDAALAGLEDASLVKDFPPLRWEPEPEDDKAQLEHEKQPAGLFG